MQRLNDWRIRGSSNQRIKGHISYIINGITSPASWNPKEIHYTPGLKHRAGGIARSKMCPRGISSVLPLPGPLPCAWVQRNEVRLVAAWYDPVVLALDTTANDNSRPVSIYTTLPPNEVSILDVFSRRFFLWKIPCLDCVVLQEFVLFTVFMSTNSSKWQTRTGIL